LQNGINSFVSPVEWKCWDGYVDSILNVTVKRDPLGLPLVFIAMVLPQVFSPITEDQVPRVMKQLGVLKGGNGLNNNNNNNNK